MGNITQICNQTDYVVSAVGAPLENEVEHFTDVEFDDADEQLKVEFKVLQQQEEFRDFCSGKVLKKHTERNEYYFGEWRDGNRRGKGLVYSPNEYLYYGDVDRMPQGRGKLKLYAQNIEIEGQMREGRPEGECRIRDLSGLYTFEGLINHQKLPTSGRFEVTNTSSPEKSYSIILDDYPNSRARIQFKDGCEYVGQISFESLLPQGKGEAKYPNESVYEGGWENGQYHGEGKFTWSDGSYYHGNYTNGVKQGKGSYTYVSHKVYKGGWINGKQDGYGILFSPEGHRLKQGMWKNGAYLQEEVKEQRAQQ